jgi:hypothetical protein
MSSLGILIVSILMGFYELPSLIGKKLYKESFIFCCLLSTGTFVTMLLVLGVPIPNPLDWIIMFIRPLSNFIDYLLK